MENESSFFVVVVVAFDLVPAVELVVFGLFFSDFKALTLFAAVSLDDATFFGPSLPLFVVTVSLADATTFVVCTATDDAFGFGSVVGDAFANVFFGVSNVDFVDEPSNFFAISNESKSNESRFALDGFVTFFTGADFLSSLAFDLPTCSAVFS